MLRKTTRTINVNGSAHIEVQDAGMLKGGKVALWRTFKAFAETGAIGQPHEFAQAESFKPHLEQ